MNKWLLAFLVIPVMASASPQQRGFSLVVPATSDPFIDVAPSPARPRTDTTFQPAPLPNRDIYAPRGPRASNAPSVSPSLFTRKDQYRGEGFFGNSTAQIEQERNVKPGAGFSLHMPLTGQ